jgi:hypothetical protein
VIGGDPDPIRIDRGHTLQLLADVDLELVIALPRLHRTLPFLCAISSGESPLRGSDRLLSIVALSPPAEGFGKLRDDSPTSD